MRVDHREVHGITFIKRFGQQARVTLDAADHMRKNTVGT
jgi:hypothetical protein